MDFVKHHQTAGLFREKQAGIGQLGPINARLQVQIQSINALDDAVGKGGLADLTRADQRDRRLAAQSLGNGLLCVAGNHPC